MLLWIKGSPTPQEIRKRLLDRDSEFQRAMIEYLEGAHAGEFLTGSAEQVEEAVKEAEKERNYVKPSLELPKCPPKLCKRRKGNSAEACPDCQPYMEWQRNFESTVDNLLFRLNRHKHHAGCTDPKHETCKSRFPRDTHPVTTVDPETGSIIMRQNEAWLNTFSYVLTYVLRCNTDVTSLLSGTAIKSIIAYITDYITKTPLKTHVMFDAVRTVFER
ncbi:hypothetical protein FA95DRAFT_1459816, partial [Auriscalpium vulgare]